MMDSSALPLRAALAGAGHCSHRRWPTIFASCPRLVLSVFGMMIMVVDPLLDEENSQKSLGTIALIGSLAALFRLSGWRNIRAPAFSDMVRVEGFSVFFHFLVIAIAAVVILSSYEYMAVQRIRAGEYYGLILFGTVGMCLMSSAIELVLIFIALEISSISTYILAGFRRRDAASSESSLKYFLLGSFATAFFLYGVALMFGATGSTNIDAITRTALRSGNAPCRFWPMLRRRSCSWAWASKSPPRPSTCGLPMFTKALRLRSSA